MHKQDFFKKKALLSFLEELYGKSTAMLCCYTEDNQLLFCTDAYLKLFDCSKMEQCRDNFYKFTPPTQAHGEKSEDLFRENLKLALTNSTHSFPWIHINSSKKTICVNYTLLRIMHESTPIITAILNVTREADSTQDCTDSYDKNAKAIFETSPLASCLWSHEQDLIDCNQSFMSLLGIKSKAEYKNSSHAFYPTYQNNGKNSTLYSQQLLDLALEHGEYKTEWLWENSEGEIIPTYVILRCIQFGSAKMIGEYIFDLRELRSFQHQANEAEIRSKVVIDAMPISTTFWDKDYNVVDCNPACLELFGLKSKQEYIDNHKKVFPEFQKDGRNSLTCLFEKFEEAKKHGISHLDCVHMHQSQTLIPVAKTCVSSKFNGEDIFLTFSQDMRELNASKEIAQAAELRNKLILDSMPLGTHFWNKNFELIDCNLESWELFGFASKEEKLQNYKSIFPKTQNNGEDSLEKLKNCLTEAFEYGFSLEEFDCIIPSKNKALPVEINFSRADYQDGFAVIAYLRDLREFNSMLAEIKNVENNLRHAKHLAEKNAAAKSEFLANMSHELRTPMNGILGLLHLLKNTPLNDDQYSYVTKSLFSGQNLLRIVDDILDFSNLEAGQISMDKEPFKLMDILLKIQEVFHPMATKKGLEFKLAIKEDSTLLLGDAARLQQVLFNILDNAIKFTDEGSITIGVDKKIFAQNEVQYTFIVRDTGIGIEKDKMHTVFAGFTQGDTSFTRKYGGTGLGLGISQNIVQLMDGKIWVESEPGKGSTFYCCVIFPIVETSSDYYHDIHDNPYINAEGSTSEKLGGHLLLVEDNEINQMVADEILQQAGFSVDIANNGKEALDMLEKTDYDLVLMDIQMPIMDGLTATKHIREQTKYNSLPVIAMSAHALEEDKQKSIAHGMNEHITKPIVPETLYKTIYYWLNVRKRVLAKGY